MVNTYTYLAIPTVVAVTEYDQCSFRTDYFLNHLYEHISEVGRRATYVNPLKLLKKMLRVLHSYKRLETLFS